MSLDAIEIRGLKVPTHVGWTDEERSEPQTVSIDVTLHADLAAAGLSDDLADTVDYDALIREIDGLVRASKSRLIEHLAEEIATLISRFRPVQRVTVQISKSDLQLEGVEFGDVSVRIERTL